MVFFQCFVFPTKAKSNHETLHVGQKQKHENCKRAKGREATGWQQGPRRIQGWGSKKGCNEKKKRKGPDGQRGKRKEERDEEGTQHDTPQKINTHNKNTNKNHSLPSGLSPH